MQFKNDLRSAVLSLLFTCTLLLAFLSTQVFASDQNDSFQGSTGFSSTQGQNGWYYLEKTSNGYINMTWDSVNNRWHGSGYCIIGDNWQHPDENESARKWVAAKSGNIIIRSYGNIRKSSLGVGGDGVTAKVYKNDELLWQSSIEGTDTTGIPFPQMAMGVAAGDSIYLVINKNSTTYYDTTIWDPVVTYITQSGDNAAAYLYQYNPTSDGTYGIAVAEPVDTATGAHVLQKSLLALKGARELTFNIQYYSLQRNQGPLGKGWKHDYEAYLEFPGSNNIKVHWNQNSANTFTQNGDEYTCSDLSMKNTVLSVNTDGSYLLTMNDRSQYLFNPAGKLTKILNSKGQAFELSNNSSGLLSQITEPLSGRQLTIAYNTSGLISTVGDALNRQVSFNYDSNNNLTSVTDTDGNTTTYTYDSDGRVLSGTNAGGSLFFSNTYDDCGRLASQFDGITGHTEGTFTYDETTQIGKLITTYTDRNGNTNTYEYDNKYNLLAYTDGLSNTTNYTYDADGNRLTETNAQGNSIAYTYDARGNILTITDPADNITTMTYDEQNNLLSKVNPAGKTTGFTYDGNNNLISVTDALNNTTTNTYDTNSLPLTKTTPGGKVTIYTYSNGLLTGMTDPANAAFSYEYDAAGRLIESTDASNNSTTYTYNNKNQILSITDPLGNTISYTYDSRGNKLSETDAKGNTTSYSYNGNDKMISMTDALGNVTQYAYDGEGRLTGTTDAGGHTTTYTYDAAGRLTGTTDPSGNTTTMGYDVLGNILSVTDALGNNVNTYTYDNQNNYLTTTDALGNVTTNEYDELSRLITVSDPLERLTQFNYDDLNRLTGAIDPLEGESTQTFDADGNRTTLTDPNNNNLGFTFDQSGRLTTITDAAGNTIEYEYDSLGRISEITNGRGQTTDYTYNAAGRIISTVDPTGQTTYTYDANGNVTSITDSTGAIGKEYDELNRLTGYTDVYGKEIQYAYNAVGNLTTLTYPDGKVVSYNYNSANRLIKVTDWNNRETSYSYDDNGRLIQTIRPDGSVETRTYNDAGQLTELKDTAEDATIINDYTFTYDAAGKTTSEENTTGTEPSITAGTTGMTYTNDNRLATYNGQTVTYDADGNMTTGPLGSNMAEFEYDSRNRLISTGDITYTYDALNNRVALTENATTTRYVVNPNATYSQVLMETDGQGNPTKYYVYGLGLIGEEDANDNYLTYHYDRRGSTTAITDEDGNITDQFEYTAYGELVNHNGSTQTSFLYNGKDGVMTDSNGLLYMRARYYNSKIKRFINRDVLLGSVENGSSLNRYAYVNGNPVSYVDPFGLCADGEKFSNKLEKAFQIMDELGTSLMISDPIPNGSIGLFSFADNAAGGLLAGMGKVGKLIEKGVIKLSKWGMWSDLEKVTLNGKEYAKINGRYFTREAVDRMTPKGYGTAAGGYPARGIPPSVVNDVIENGVSRQVTVKNELRTIYELDGIRVVTSQEGQIVITTYPY